MSASAPSWPALDVDDVTKLAATGARIRELDPRDALPAATSSRRCSTQLRKMSGGTEIAVAVRSSATAEDLPEASFAGQQETFLNVRGEAAVLRAMHEVFASLFNDRAISYRVHQNFDHSAVALSAGVQHMVRSDLGAGGVMFTLDTDSGFRDVVFITASYGLGETVVQGAVNPDEFYVYKPALRAGKHAILRRNLGGKAIKMVYAPEGSAERVHTVEVPHAERAALLPERCGHRGAGAPGADHRGALRPPDGHRVGQGWRHRCHLHPAGTPGDGAEPRRAHHPALRAQGRPRQGPRHRPQHRPAHRLRAPRA